MKTLKRLFTSIFTMAIFYFTILFSYAVFAVENTVPNAPAISTPPIGGNWQDWLGWGLGVALFVLIEIVLRLVKTEKNYSIVLWIAKIVDFLFGIFAKNKATDGTTHVISTDTKRL